MLHQILDRVRPSVEQVAVIAREADERNLAVIGETLDELQDAQIPHTPNQVLLRVSEQHRLGCQAWPLGSRPGDRNFD